MSYYNPGMREERGRLFFLENSTETTIATQDVWTAIATGSAWEVDAFNSGMSIGDDNLGLKYSYSTPRTMMIYLDAEVEGAGNNLDFEIALEKNSVLVAASTFNYNYKTIPLASSHMFLLSLQEGDTLEMKIRNTTDTTNVTLHHAEISCWAVG